MAHPADLSLFFNSLPEELVAETESYSDQYFASDIFCNSFPRVIADSVSLVGLPDVSQSDDPWKVPDAFRAQFYKLKRTARNVLFYDLGNLRPGDDAALTDQRLTEVCAAIIEQGSVPLLISSRRENQVAHFKAYMSRTELNLANIDSTMDLDQENGILHKVVTQAGHLPSHFCQMAYQSYLVDPMGLSVMDRLHFESLRLGQIHEDFRTAEPMLRDADLAFFNMSALRTAAFGSSPGMRPFGLNGEQACQLCWYAGTSPKLSSIGFYNVSPQAAKSEMDMQTLAIMVWHFLEGYSYRHKENPADERSCEKYLVPMSGTDDLIFYRSRITDRWWMHVPDHGGKTEGYLLPCLYSEYLQAVNGQLPDRWMKTYGRIN